MALDVSKAIIGIASPLLYVGTGVCVALALGLWWSYTDPLRHIPGPFLARLTPSWLWWHTWTGVECRTIDALHKMYGSVVRIAPNEVDISDSVAVNTIYIKNGGYLKSPNYRNYDVNGFETIFSTLDPVHRAIRAKAVAPMFAHQNIAKGRPVVQKVVDCMVTELERRKAESHGKPVDVLNLFRALALDTVTVYLFGESFNGIGKDMLSATDFIDNFGVAGRCFYLPGWVFDRVDKWTAKLDKNRVPVEESTAIVQEYAARVVNRSMAAETGDSQTYQGRLLGAGVSREEAIAQVVDVMFAGTDAAGTTMSILCWNLQQFPDIYERARKETLENPGHAAEPLPYLSGIVKESLRLSMANPTRFPRIVSPGGMHVPGLPDIPEGTSVGLGAHMLHHNRDVFPKPYEFVPERWLEPTQEMLRDSFYFGVGSRQCIARNLAFAGLWWAAEAIIRSDVLRGGKPVKDKIETIQWFNVKIVGGKIELQWPLWALPIE